MYAAYQIAAVPITWVSLNFYLPVTGFLKWNFHIVVHELNNFN